MFVQSHSRYFKMKTRDQRFNTKCAMVYTAAIVSINKSSAIADTASQCFISRIIAFVWGYLSLTHSSSVAYSLRNMATNHIHCRKL